MLTWNYPVRKASICLVFEKRGFRVNHVKPLNSPQLEIPDQSQLYSPLKLVFRVRAYCLTWIVITEPAVQVKTARVRKLKPYASNMQIMLDSCRVSLEHSKIEQVRRKAMLTGGWHKMRVWLPSEPIFHL